MTIRVGIVGTGGISRAHQRTYMKVGGFEIVAVCDIIKSKANEAAEQWGVPKKTSSQATTKCLRWTRSIQSVSALTIKDTADQLSRH